ncbi:MAG: YgiT-type zinc finger protein [Anaerolineales bacterium]|nr:YgiT-type zinc finger protein [Anaerolineales bacterium]
MTDEKDQDNWKENCPECQMGTLRSGSVPYYAKLEETLVVVPDFPAWICDICRHCEYDESALDALRIILGPSAHIPALPTPRKRLPAEDPFSGLRNDTRKGSK